MEIRLRLLGDNDSFEIATPNGAVTLLRTGDYRIDADPDRDAAMLTVRSGQAELFSGSNSTIIRARETAYFRENQDPDIRSANDPDAFDSFTSSRDGDTPVSASAVADSHVPEEMTGAEDLSAYGSWQNSSGYGEVWVPPSTPSGLLQRRRLDLGRSLGVDLDRFRSLGFAPFHYGRWPFPAIAGSGFPARVPRRWSMLLRWWPFRRRPERQRQLVPSAPRGHRIPPSRIPAAIRLRAQSTPRSSPTAFLPARSIFSRVDFTAARHVRPGMTLAPDGPLLGSAPQVAPVRDSVLAGTVRPRPPAAIRSLVARTAPPPAPILFYFKQPLLAQNHGRPLAPAQATALRRQAPYAVEQVPMVHSNRPLVAAKSAKPVPSKAPAKPVRQSQ